MTGWVPGLPHQGAPLLLIGQDGEGGRLVALASPPGQAPKPLFRLTSLGAHIMAVALSQPVGTWEAVPVELCAEDK